MSISHAVVVEDVDVMLTKLEEDLDDEKDVENPNKGNNIQTKSGFTFDRYHPLEEEGADVYLYIYRHGFVLCQFEPNLPRLSNSC